MQIHEEDFENVDPGEPRILFPDEGVWPAQFIRWEAKGYGPWGEKLIVQWRVLSACPTSSPVTLSRYYNLQRGAGNRFKFGPLHAFRKDWIAANGGRHPLDRSKLPLSIFKGRTFLVEIVTVRNDARGPLPPSLYWSKVGRVIRPLEAGERWEGSTF